MAPNMTVATKMTILNIHFALFCLIKCDSVNRMFPLALQDISEWGSGYELKIINRGVLIRLVGKPHVYEVPGNSCFIVARAIGAHEALFNL